jgi:hypothetical protein
MVDGEVVVLDESGRPSSNTLQNHGSANVQIITFSAQRLQRWRVSRKSEE